MSDELYRLAECRIAAVDLRGHGETSGCSQDMSMQALSSDIRCVADQLIHSGAHKVGLIRYDMIHYNMI